MHRVFNCGIGMVLAVAPADLDAVMQLLEGAAKPPAISATSSPGNRVRPRPSLPEPHRQLRYPGPGRRIGLVVAADAPFSGSGDPQSLWARAGTAWACAMQWPKAKALRPGPSLSSIRSSGMSPERCSMTGVVSETSCRPGTTGAAHGAARGLRARIAPAGPPAGRRYFRGSLRVPDGGSFRWLNRPPPPHGRPAISRSPTIRPTPPRKARPAPTADAACGVASAGGSWGPAPGRWWRCCC